MPRHVALDFPISGTNGIVDGSKTLRIPDAFSMLRGKRFWLVTLYADWDTTAAPSHFLLMDLRFQGRRVRNGHSAVPETSDMFPLSVSPTTSLVRDYGNGEGIELEIEGNELRDTQNIDITVRLDLPASVKAQGTQNSF